MKKLNLMFTALALSLALAAFGQSAADGQGAQSAQGAQGEHQGRRGGPGMSPDAQLEHMSQVLNLTDDQKTQIKPILERQSKKMHDLMQDSSVSQEDKRAKFQQIHQDTMDQVRPLLNDDQKKKLDDFMQHQGREGHDRNRPNHDQSNPQ
ncbi:MAG: hypothetical protein JO065_02620 [Acidobacteria bacterium]|nr:hypothetical protein [Acidobacteriota bacterium]